MAGARAPPLALRSRRIKVTYTLLEGTTCLSCVGEYPTSYWQQGRKVSLKSTSPSLSAPVLTFGRTHSLPTSYSLSKSYYEVGGSPPNPVDQALAF